MAITHNPQEKNQLNGHQETVAYYAKSVEDCFQLLRSEVIGLKESEVKVRQEKYGKNLVSEKREVRARSLFLKQFKNLVIILLFISSMLSFYMGEPISGVAILVALMINIGISFFTKWKAQNALFSLEDFSTPLCTVVRGGIAIRIPAVELVPGDVIQVSSGQTVPADARLISDSDIQVDESALTGESVLVVKQSEQVLPVDQDLPEQTNMLFAGTTIKTGRGQALVTATGQHSHIGKIAALASEARKRESHLAKALNRLGMTIFGVVIVLAAITTFLGYQQGMPFFQMLQIGILLVVAAVPEILPAVATFILSLGVERLSREKAIVRNLHAIESIGGITVICSDKTGTLTENSLSVHQVFVPEFGVMDYNPLWAQAQGIPTRSVEELLRIGRLNNMTILDGVRSHLMGDPIDVALYRATPPEYETGYHRIKEFAFDSHTMRMATIYRHQEGQCAAMIKGAPEKVLEICNYYLAPDGKVLPMDKDQRIEFMLANQDLAMDGILRVIAFAEKPLASPEEEPYHNAIFVGMVCLIDPPKTGVKEAVQACQDAGLRFIMITGDQKATAAIMAQELGILKPGMEVWTRRDLDNGVEKIPPSVCVFARTQPEEKLAIVQSLQASGDIVAMVGDGVNDAPALRKSDIAIAMGIRGAEAAKDSSDIILLNDRFETIASAVYMGRMLTSNVKLCVEYLLSCDIGLVTMMLLAVVLGVGLPLNALQILWLNIIIMTIPALSLAYEPPSQSSMNQGFKHYDQNVLSASHLMLIGFWGLLLTAAGLGTFFTATHLCGLSIPVASTLTFCTLAFSQTLHLLNIQAVHSGGNKLDFLVDILSVPMTWVILGSTFAFQLAAVYIPFLHPVLGTTHIEPVHWLIPMTFSFLMVAASFFMIHSEEA